MGAVSTLCQASSSVLLFSQAFGDHCRGLSSSSICFFNNNRKSRGRWATFGTLLLSYSSTVGGVGGRRTVVSNLSLKGSGGDHIEGSDGGFDGDDGSNNSNDNDTGNGDGESSKSGSMSMSPKLTLAYAALVGEETKRRASSQSCDDIKAGDSTNNLVSVDNPNAVTPGLGNDKLSSVRTVALWVCAAVTFGVVLGMKDGVGKASEFFAGYLLEQSLSVDNLFVFVLIFRYFKVPIIYQSRVLSYGIAGAIIFRASMILLGTATLQRFEVVNLLLASILLFSSYKLFAGEEEEADLSDNFIVKTCQKFIPVTSNYDGDRFFKIQDGAWQATPLLLTVAVIELSDIAFAVDSIPAVFGVTRDPFIVFSSNLFAILGLRSLYTLISESMSELEYIQPAIGVVLGFIGCKMILDFFGYHISTEASLGLVATSLSCGVLLSLIKKKSD